MLHAASRIPSVGDAAHAGEKMRAGASEAMLKNQSNTTQIN